jgi:hypothetical protein
MCCYRSAIGVNHLIKLFSYAKKHYVITGCLLFAALISSN